MTAHEAAATSSPGTSSAARIAAISGLVFAVLFVVSYLVFKIGRNPTVIAGYGASNIALGVAALWGVYGLVYFLRSSKSQGKEIILTNKPALA